MDQPESLAKAVETAGRPTHTYTHSVFTCIHCYNFSPVYYDCFITVCIVCVCVCVCVCVILQSRELQLVDKIQSVSQKSLCVHVRPSCNTHITLPNE